MKILKLFRLTLTARQKRIVEEQLAGMAKHFTVAQTRRGHGTLDVGVVSANDKHSRAFRAEAIKAIKAQNLTMSDVADL